MTFPRSVERAAAQQELARAAGPRNSAPGATSSRADLHIHTTFSDGVASPEDVLNYYAVHTGCRVVAITDHDTLDGARCARRHAEEHPDLYGGLEVIVGEEVSTRDGHVIGLFLEEWIPPGLSAAETVAAIHAQGGLAVAAHPYTSWMKWAGLVGVGDLIKTLPFDAVETMNSNFTEVLANRKAARNAGPVARLGSSDGHFLGAVGKCYTDFPGATGADLRAAIQARVTSPGGSCYGPVTLCRYILEQLRSRGSIWPQMQRFRRQSAVGGLSIRVEREPAAGMATVAPAGRIDALSMPELKETLREIAQTGQSIVVDLAGVTGIDASGVTALVAGMKHALANGAGFCLTRAPGACLKAIAGAGLSRALPRALNSRLARERIGRQILELRRGTSGSEPASPPGETLVKGGSR